MDSRLPTSNQHDVVSKEVIEGFRNWSSILNIEFDDLFVGVEHLKDREFTITWDEYLSVFRKITSKVESEEALFECAKLTYRQRKPAFWLQSMSLFREPTQVILGSAKIVSQFFRHIEAQARVREDGWIEFEASIPTSYSPERLFFVVMAGSLSGFTTLLGLPPAYVEYEATGHSGQVLIQPPKPRTLWSKIKARFAVIRNSDATVKLLQLRQAELEKREQGLRKALKERSVALEERAKALAAEKVARMSRDRFLQAMGHELRTPFNGLLHTTQAIQESTVDAERRELFKALMDSSCRLCFILDSVLTYAKLSSGDVSWQPSAHKLRDLGESVRSSSMTDYYFRANINYSVPQEKSVQLNFLSVPDEWWMLDTIQLVRIGHELVVNALIHSPDHSSVELELGVNQHELLMRVKDYGPGLSKEKMALAFEPFEQLDKGEVRKTQGSGLGLPIVKAIVDGIGGQLELGATEENRGLDVRVRVPVQPAHSVQTQVCQRRVLVVDDDATNRMVAKRILEKLGCSVSVAIDGRQAIDRVKSESFDLILMDCEMPNLDGWSATRELRAEGQQLPVIAATAYASEADRARCKDVGMNDFMAKPLIPTVLSAIIDKWLGPRRDEDNRGCGK